MTRGDLVLELAIGEDRDAPPEYQFASIASMMVDREGRLWVIDGDASYGSDQTPMIRLYDSNGSFLARVGRDGSGPGEYRVPRQLAQLPDGRVVLGDSGLPDRITVFNSDGALDTLWSLPPEIRAQGAVLIDTAGVLWLPFRPMARPGPDRGDLPYLRVREGVVLDTVTAPPMPEVRGPTVRGVTLPYQPRGFRVWHPFGAFVTGSTDIYRMEIVRPGTADRRGSSPIVAEFRRIVEPVPVPSAERSTIRAEIIADLRERDAADTGIPESPTHKPPIRWVYVSPDGHLWVLVAMPSVQHDRGWSESTAFDVFDPGGGYLGRVILPESLVSFVPTGAEQLWGVWRDEQGVESIRRYAVSWR